MNKPVIANTKPFTLTLEPGKYYWCACGHSQNQPFCDGAHKGTGFAPIAFEVEKEKKMALCLCKQTQSPPLCDGAHSTLSGH